MLGSLFSVVLDATVPLACGFGLLAVWLGLVAGFGVGSIPLYSRTHACEELALWRR